MRIPFLALFMTLAVAAGGCAPTPAPASNATATSPGRPGLPAPFAWPGIYDLVGTGFPEGTRVAVMAVEQHDTAYVLTLQGPPGRLLSLRIAGDSAHVAWDLGPNTMYVELRGSGDMLEGSWQIDSDSGSVRGTRRR